MAIRGRLTCLVMGLSVLVVAAVMMCGCTSETSKRTSSDVDEMKTLMMSDQAKDTSKGESSAATEQGQSQDVARERVSRTAMEWRELLNIGEGYRDSFVHGAKNAVFQKYIVLHDTEGTEDASSVVASWDASGTGSAAHFIINTDGSIVQCVPLDFIAHHAGYGDTGHNASFGITEDGRDDKEGLGAPADGAGDCALDSWSIGIALVHAAGSGDYPQEQLEALDGLIAYLDAYYEFESTITDHKAWRTGSADTSAEFEPYLANYLKYRTHS